MENGWVDRYVGGRMGQWADECVGGQKRGRMGDGQMSVWVDRWVGGCRGRQEEEQIKE